VKRQRADHHHKTALALVRAYDTLYLEDVQVANLVRNRHLAKTGQEHQRCRLGAVPDHPRVHGSMGRHAGGSGACPVHQPGL
jgi:hypothetical protein